MKCTSNSFLCVPTPLTSGQTAQLGQNLTSGQLGSLGTERERGEPGGSAGGGRSKVEKETISGKGKNVRQWVGRGGSVGKCGREKLSDETHFEEEQNPQRNAMLLMFLLFDVKTTPKTFNMPSR